MKESSNRAPPYHDDPPLQGNGSPKHPVQRPWPVTVLCVILLLGSLARLLRTILSISQWALLTTLPLTVSPLYLSLKGFVWSVVGFALLPGMWKGFPWARRGTWVGVTLYITWTWIELLWIKAPEIRNTRWPFTAAITILGGGLVFTILNLPRSRAYFDQANNEK